jgi:hypothetical protein
MLRITYSRVLSAAYTLAGLAVFVGSAEAQTPPDTGITPLAMAPGTPAGTYALSDLDNVNLFSGAMVFRLPLVKIGGRGGVSHTIALTIERHWGVKVNQTGQAFLRDDWFRGGNPGYGPGIMRLYRGFTIG